MKILLALFRREILEHKNLWRVPLVLIGIAVLVKLSLSFGNLALDIQLPEQLELDNQIDSAVDAVIANVLNAMNAIVMWVMFLVAIFYALACLFNERQDQSVLFWRSLPISDSLTVASKLIPLAILATQTIIAILFFGAQSVEYLAVYFGKSIAILVQVILWSLLPIVSWCVLCSEVARKNPFLLAVIAPILVIVVDKLFFNGVLSQTLIINRFSNFSEFAVTPLVLGVVFSIVCIVLTVIKRSQRI